MNPQRRWNDRHRNRSSILFPHYRISAYPFWKFWNLRMYVIPFARLHIEIGKETGRSPTSPVG
jgi:hypothetical protein